MIYDQMPGRTRSKHPLQRDRIRADTISLAEARVRVFVFVTGLVALPSYSPSGSTSFEACKADASGGDVVILSYISLRSTVRNTEDVAPWRPDGWIKDRLMGGSKMASDPSNWRKGHSHCPM